MLDWETLDWEMLDRETLDWETLDWETLDKGDVRLGFREVEIKQLKK